MAGDLAPFQLAHLPVSDLDAARVASGVVLGIVAICAGGKYRQAIPILDLPLPDPPPQGTEWIAAYRRWAR